VRMGVRPIPSGGGASGKDTRNPAGPLTLARLAELPLEDQVSILMDSFFRLCVNNTALAGQVVALQNLVRTLLRAMGDGPHSIQAEDILLESNEVLEDCCRGGAEA
jgi:hypothetical protein